MIVFFLAGLLFDNFEISVGKVKIMKEQCISTSGAMPQ
jgi:hypothetical protein